MKKIIKRSLLFAIFVTFLSACSNSDSPVPDLKGKAFYGVAVSNCGSSTPITNLTSNEYVLMTFEDVSGNDVSYQPKPNTWYKMGFSNTRVKTGSDVTPKDSPGSFGFLTTEYTTPCQ